MESLEIRNLARHFLEPDSATDAGLLKAMRSMSSDDRYMFMVAVENLSWWKTNPTPVFLDDKEDVHTEHCCRRCGCRYGSLVCTVVNGVRKQSYGCGETNECD